MAIINELLEKFGYDSDTIKKIIAEDAALTTASLWETGRNNMTKLLLQDKEVTDKIRSEASLGAYSTAEKKLRKIFGLKDDDEVTKDMKFEELAKHAYEKTRKEMEGQNKDQLDKKLLEEIDVHKSVIARLESEKKRIVEEDIPAVKKGYDRRIEDIHTNTELLKMLTTQKLTVSPKAAAATLRESFEEKGYTVKMENGELKLVNKADDSTVMTADRSEIISLDKFSRKIFEQERMIQLANPGGGTPTPNPNNPNPINPLPYNGGTKVNLPGMDAIDERLNNTPTA